MALIPYKQQPSFVANPFYELEKIHRGLNRAFDLSLWGEGDKESSLLSGLWSPAVDVLDTKDSIIVRAEMPGMSKEDIDITIENNVLSIRGEKKEKKDYKQDELVRTERFYGMFHRTFTLPSQVATDKVTAKLNDGVLELTMLKKEEAKPKHIKVDVK
jgi:HSP20 family protein